MCPRQLLGLQPSPYYDKMNFPDLSAMVYRDTLQQKHLERDRLAAELSEKKQLEDTMKKAFVQAIAGPDTVNRVGEIIIEHMLAVHCQCLRVDHVHDSCS